MANFREDFTILEDLYTSSVYHWMQLSNGLVMIQVKGVVEETRSRPRLIGRLGSSMSLTSDETLGDFVR